MRVADDTNDNCLYLDMNHENTPSGQAEDASNLERRDSDGSTFRPEPIVLQLSAYMNRTGMSVRDLATALEVPYPTLTAGMRGDRPFPSSKDVRKKLSDLLHVTGLQVAIWCGLLEIDDFIYQRDFDQTAAAAFSLMRQDQRISHLLPPNQEDVDAWDRTAKSFAVGLYQEYVRATDENPVEIIPRSEIEDTRPHKKS